MAPITAEASSQTDSVASVRQVESVNTLDLSIRSAYLSERVRSAWN